MIKNPLITIAQASATHRKSLAFVAPIIAVLLSVSAQAGEAVVTDSKSVAPAPPPPEIFGTGFYMALDLGANVYQNRVSNETFTNELGDTLAISTDNNVGFYGGLKAGYVFGTGIFRPTIEGDFFYNGWEGGGTARLTTADGSVGTANFSGNINTGAFMSNFIGRFAFGRFQPYVGAGVGLYYAASPGFTVNTDVGTFNTVGSRTHTDLAWDIIAGADYYFTPKMSTFIEYHYLDYTSSQIDTNQNRNLGQQLVGAGMRFHF
jgi:opacity protein-like surface antigen